MNNGRGKTLKEIHLEDIHHINKRLEADVFCG